MKTLIATLLIMTSPSLFATDQKEEDSRSISQKRELKARENQDQRWRASEVLKQNQDDLRQLEEEPINEPAIDMEDDYNKKEGSAGF